MDRPAVDNVATFVIDKQRLSNDGDLLLQVAEYLSGDDLVSRFQFVAGHEDTFEVNDCVTLSRSSSSRHSLMLDRSLHMMGR